VDIVTALTTHHGNLDTAFQEMNKLQLQPFLQQVWKQPDMEKEGGIQNGADNRTAENGENYLNKEFRKQVRRLLALGLVATYEKGELAAELMSRGYEEKEAVAASQRAEDITQAEQLLRKECEICSTPMEPREVSDIVNSDQET
jgi:hypothetical protein